MPYPALGHGGLEASASSTMTSSMLQSVSSLFQIQSAFAGSDFVGLGAAGLMQVMGGDLFSDHQSRD